MSKRRVQRVQDLIREEVSRLLLFKIKDPRLRTVSVTSVEMTSDIRIAKIFYSLFDDQADRDDVQQGLESATGFLRREVGHNLGLKYVPELVFLFDRSLEYARHMDKVLSEITAASKPEDKR